MGAKKFKQVNHHNKSGKKFEKFNRFIIKKKVNLINHFF